MYQQFCTASTRRLQQTRQNILWLLRRKDDAFYCTYEDQDNINPSACNAKTLHIITPKSITYSADNAYMRFHLIHFVQTTYTSKVNYQGWKKMPTLWDIPGYSWMTPRKILLLRLQGTATAVKVPVAKYLPGTRQTHKCIGIGVENVGNEIGGKFSKHGRGEMHKRCSRVTGKREANRGPQRRKKGIPQIKWTSQKKTVYWIHVARGTGQWSLLLKQGPTLQVNKGEGISPLAVHPSTHSSLFLPTLFISPPLKNVYYTVQLL